MKLKAIIVEDEAASRETLDNYINKYCPDVELMAKTESVNQRLEAIKEYQPYIVFWMLKCLMPTDMIYWSR